jgi:DNA-binding transcriptional LysR family regulator
MNVRIHLVSASRPRAWRGRTGRGLQPTEAGLAFAPYAEDVVGLLNTGHAAAREASAIAAAQLRIAAATTAAESFVPRLMRSFSRQHPEVELALAVGNDRDVLSRLMTHTDDVAICGKPPRDSRLSARPFLDNRIVCITSPADPAIGGPPLRASALAERSWLLREPGSGTRALTERFLMRRRMAPRTLTLGSTGAIRQAAHEHLGIALLAHVAVEADLEHGWLGEIKLLDGPAPQQWFVLRSAVGPVRPQVEEFTAFLRAVAADRVLRTTGPRVVGVANG